MVRAFWKDTDEALVRKLAAQGKTCDEVAKLMGKPRGAVGAFASRHKIKFLGKKFGGKSNKHGKLRTQMKVTLPRKEAIPLSESQENMKVFDELFNGVGISLLDAGAFQCRWPFDSNEKFARCCGEHVADVTQSYCLFHKEKAEGRSMWGASNAKRDADYTVNRQLKLAMGR